MAKKELSIILRAVNEAGGTLNAVRGQLGAMGGAAEKADKQSTGLFSRMISWATSAKGIVASLGVYFSVRGIVGGLRETGNEIDLIAKTSKRLGLSTEYLSELKHAADLSGVEFATLSYSISNAAKNVSQFVRTGGGRAADAIRQLGVEARGSNGELLGTEDLMDRLIVALGRVKNAGQQVELTKRIFGNDRLLQFIKEGGERLAIMREEARRLGISIGPEMAARIEGFNDSMTRIGAAWWGIKASILSNIAPFLTDLINRVAGFLAAIPKMLSYLAGTIGKALSGDAESIAKLNRFVSASQDLIWAGILSTLRVGKVLAVIGVQTLLRAVQGEAESWAGQLPERIFIKISQAYNEFLNSADKKLLGTSDPITRWFLGTGIGQERLDALQTELDHLDRTAEESRAFSRRAAGTSSQGVKSLSTDYVELRDAVAGVRSESEGVVKEWLDAANGVLNWRSILEGTDITSLVKQYNAAGDAAKETVVKVSLLSEIQRGMVDQFAEIGTEIQRAYELGQQLTQSLTTGLANGVGSALVSVLDRTKSFGAAMREVLANLARNVATLIFQFLALRAIMGIAGAFTAAPTGLAPGAIGGVDASNSAFAAVARDGGEVSRSMRFAMVPHMVGGGVVPGIGVSRNYDSVLANLTPGERVIREPVSRQHARKLDRLNATGQWEGGGTVVNLGGITVNVNGSGGSSGSYDAMARAVKRAAADGVLEALQTRPGFRGAVKGALA